MHQLVQSQGLHDELQQLQENTFLITISISQKTCTSSRQLYQLMREKSSFKKTQIQKLNHEPINTLDETKP